MNQLKLCGLILFIGGSLALMGIITAEAMYPSGYTTNANEISDLGATKPPNSVSFQPSAGIFNTTMLLAGALILVAAFFQHTYLKKFLFSIPLLLFGLGLMGVGIFPGNKGAYHGLSAMLAFLSGGVCAITSFKIVSAPFKYIGILFGLIALASWFTAVLSPGTLFPVIGIGGTERWVAYPIMLWLTGLGGYLMNKKKV